MAKKAIKKALNLTGKASTRYSGKPLSEKQGCIFFGSDTGQSKFISEALGPKVKERTEAKSPNSILSKYSSSNKAFKPTVNSAELAIKTALVNALFITPKLTKKNPISIKNKKTRRIKGKTKAIVITKTPLALGRLI